MFMKKIQYTLDFKLSPPHAISWSLVKGDLIKSNDGSWSLTPIDAGVTDATMTTDVSFSMWVPKILGEGALKGEMHKMLGLFKKAAETRASKSAAKGGKSSKKS